MSAINPHARWLDSRGWHELERVVERFEQAWAGGSRPTLDDLLPADTTIRPALVVELAHAELEFRLRAGEPARAEDYLDRYPELGGDPAAALEFIASEYRIRVGQGAPVPLEEYLHRFPQYDSELRTRLSREGGVDTTPPPSGHTSQDPLATRATDEGVGVSLVAATPRVRLREPRDEAEPPLHPPSAALPERAGRCAIVGEIGRGGMGAVLKGHDPDLGRDLAVKVLLDRYRREPDLVRRFLVEAQVGGQLQHPGIVPVYDLGLLLDERPYFTMKLVRGRTLATLLAERPEPAHELPRFLKIFEQVCQTLAYAHARGVIHRDLKPANVMVGAFGEVQVMDWGLAKVLDAAGREREPSEGLAGEPGADIESRAGSVVGTPAYMPPEQARGEGELLDERCDVFGLGAILCEILTGQPPYTGRSRLDVFRQAEEGDLTDAGRRLDGCGADGELLLLTRACLAAEVGHRPRDAGEVARAMTTYLAGVQERLRAAEVERAAAQAKAEEAKAKAAAERRARRLTLGLGAAALLTVAFGSAAALWVKAQQDARDAEIARQATETQRGVEVALQEATTLRDQARRQTADAAQWGATLAAALSAVKRADGLLTSGVATEALADRVRALHAELDADEQDRQFVEELEEIRLDRATLILGDESNDVRIAAAYAEAFRRRGMDAAALPAQAVADRIRERPVRDLLVVAIEEWAGTTREIQLALKLMEVTRLADPSPWRNRFHEAILNAERKALLDLANQADVAKTNVSVLVALADTLRQVNELPAAVALLSRARDVYPSDFWLNHHLGYYSMVNEPPAYEEAVRYLTVAGALRPKSVSARYYLAVARSRQADDKKAMEACREALALRPNYSPAHQRLGAIYAMRGDFDGAIESFRRAIEFQEDSSKAHSGLGGALAEKGRFKEALDHLNKAIEYDKRNARLRKPYADYPRRNADAYNNRGSVWIRIGELDKSIADYKEAIRLKPDHALAHGGLGSALALKGRWKEALKEYQKAAQYDPKLADAHYNLGLTYQKLGDLDKSVAEYREAVQLRPRDAEYIYTLAAALNQNGALDEAAAAYRQAIALRPAYAEAHCNLSGVLKAQGRFQEALASYRRGHQLGSRQPGWPYPSDRWVREAERLVALDSKLSAVLWGEGKPADGAEGIAFAELCTVKKYDRAAARLYEQAFAADARLAEDLRAAHRYNAACAAALAACAQGADVATLDRRELPRWREQAIAWLRADLRLWEKHVAGGSAQARAAAGQMLLHWQRDPDLAGVREPAALSKLPQAEQKAWRKLWADVARHVTQARARKPVAAGAATP
jgi:serine/threonine-protein kinase